MHGIIYLHTQMINQSDVLFQELLPTPQVSESKYQKKARKEPTVKFHEENLAIDMTSIERTLGNLLDNEADLLENDTAPAAETKEEAKQSKAKPTKQKSASSSKSKAAVKEPIEVKLDHTPEEEDVEHSKRALVILNYQNNKYFGDYLKSFKLHYTLEQLNKKSVQDLDRIITQIRTLCNNKASEGSLDHMLFGATTFVEHTVSNRTAYNMRGWTNLLQADETFMESWNLIKLERMSFARMSPEARFAMSMVKNAMAAVALNQQLDQMRQQQTMNQPQSADSN